MFRGFIQVFEENCRRFTEGFNCTNGLQKVREFTGGFVEGLRKFYRVFSGSLGRYPHPLWCCGPVVWVLCRGFIKGLKEGLLRSFAGIHGSGSL